VLEPLIVEGFRLGVIVLPPHRRRARRMPLARHRGDAQRFVLIDRSGQIRAYHDGEALDPKHVVRDLRRLQDA
jgi:hypothetical protein